MLDETVRNLGLGFEAVIEPASGGARCAAWMVRTPAQRYVPRLPPRLLTDGRVDADQPAALEELRGWTAGWEAA
jgi:hypothetical protein